MKFLSFILLLFSLCILLFPFTGKAQLKTTAYGSVMFDGNDLLNPYLEIYRDTISNPGCIWQIGMPQKTVFNAALSAPNAIVTDTINTYPANDTSSFIIAQLPNFGWSFLKPGCPSLRGYYRVDSDTLADFGKIEILLNGVTGWINILDDTVYHFSLTAGKPVLSGNSGGWSFFEINFYALADSLNLPMLWNDTIFLRFTFISDSIETNKDGLMFDNFRFIDMWDNVPDVKSIFVPSVAYPNPAKDYLIIFPLADYNNRSFQLTITDGTGRQVSKNTFLKGGQIKINTAFLSPGIYHYQIRYDEGVYYSSGKFIKE